MSSAATGSAHLQRLNSTAKPYKHNAAGMMIVGYSLDSDDMYLLMALQRKKKESDAKQWNNTLSLTSGKVEKMPPDDQKNSPGYAARVKAAEDEALCPVLTAAREGWEESLGALGAVPDLIALMDREECVGLINNGLKRHLEDVKKGADESKLAKPFVVVTVLVPVQGKPDYLARFRTIIEQKQAPPVADSFEGAGLAWVHLNTLLPAEHGAGSQFFKEVFEQNQNYSIPSDCHVQAVLRTGDTTVEEVDGMGGFVIASYVARTLANDIDQVMQHLAEVRKAAQAAT